MSILLLLVPLALILGALFLWGFAWSVRSGHYDDLETPAIRMLIEEDERKLK
jgi:cbb3-type cytochrome oxidase maturation protein